jgi:hypothetical protein
MAKVYVTRCLVKKDGRQYTKGSVIEDLTDKEIKQGLAEHWLEAVGNDEEPTENKPGKPENGKKGKSGQKDLLEKMTADELIAEAAGLGLQIDNSMSEEVVREMIRKARQ